MDESYELKIIVEGVAELKVVTLTSYDKTGTTLRAASLVPKHAKTRIM